MPCAHGSAGLMLVGLGVTPSPVSSHPGQQRRWVVHVGPQLGSREVNSSNTNEIKKGNAAC